MEYDVEKISNKINNKRVTKKIFKYIILTVLIILFIINLILSFNEKTNIFGYYMFNIVSGSMEPTLGIDDVVIVQRCDLSKLHVGNIITFEQNGRVISHRVMEITRDRESIKFKTKGDKNDIADPDLVDGGQVYGKVLFRIKNIGKVINYIQNSRGFISIIIFVLIVFILVSFRDKQKNSRKMKRKKYEIKKMRDNYHL